MRRPQAEPPSSAGSPFHLGEDSLGGTGSALEGWLPRSVVGSFPARDGARLSGDKVSWLLDAWPSPWERGHFLSFLKARPWAVGPHGAVGQNGGGSY